MIKKKITTACLFAFFILMLNHAAMAKMPGLELQVNPDSIISKPEKVFKNTVRYNLTNTLMFGIKTVIVGYERTLGDHQSISINVGQLTLPEFNIIKFNVADTIIQSSKDVNQKGYHASVDYRFYLKHENKNKAPRGVYLAPYYSYNYFERTKTWTLNSTLFQGDVSTKFSLTMHTVGGELGYQFVLWKRLAIDCILLGPGVTSYSVKAKLSTSLDPDDEALLFKKINDALADKIPGYSVVIDDVEFEKSGSVSTTSIGFRYMIQLGFRF
jgi:hypothetical protein